MTVELVWTAGHSSGHAMYIDKKGRYLFAGDDVCSDVTGCGSGSTGTYGNLNDIPRLPDKTGCPPR